MMFILDYIIMTSHDITAGYRGGQQLQGYSRDPQEHHPLQLSRPLHCEREARSGRRLVLPQVQGLCAGHKEV